MASVPDNLTAMSPIPRTFGSNERQASVPELYDNPDYSLSVGPESRDAQSAPQSFQPERFQDALNVIEGNQPASPRTPREGHANLQSIKHVPTLEMLSKNELTSSEYLDHTPNKEATSEKSENENRYIHARLVPQCTMPSITLLQDPDPEALDEYAWSPPQSDDGSDIIVDPPYAQPLRSVSGIDLPWLAKSEQGRSMNGSATPNMIASTSFGKTNAKLPAINVKIPGRYNDSSAQGLSRFSGIISDGTSQRAMSDLELRNSINSIDDVIKKNLRRDESRSSQIGPLAAFGDIEAEYLHPVSSKGDLGPGSVQSSSSQSANQLRSPTPPLLYGRLTPISTSRPLGTDNRLGDVLKAHGIRKDGRLGRAYPLSSTEHDWETVSDLREILSHMASANGTDAGTGSSLADNSDSGDISLPKEGSPHPSVAGLQQHVSQPRLNQSYMIIKDHQTGLSYGVPQSEYELRDTVANTNSAMCVSQLPQSRPYHHPAPLLEGHAHPFDSSVPVIFPSHRPTNTQVKEYITGQTIPEPQPLNSELLDDDPKSMLQRKSLYELTKPVSKSSVNDTDETQPDLSSKERSYHSSAWVSTQSEADSTVYVLPRLPGRQGSFAKLAILGAKGNVTGSPDGTGAREVGSSLADASSPGAQFSSSPAPFTTTPHSQCQTPFIKTVSQNSPSSKSSIPMATSITRGPGNISNLHIPTTKEEWFQVLPPRQPELAPVHPTRRRRSSGESKSGSNTSHNMGSASEFPVLQVHGRSSTSAGLLCNRASLPKYENLLQDPEYLNLRERRARPAHLDDRSISPTKPRPFRTRDGVVYTDVPAPEFVHPVYAHERLWDRAERRIRPESTRLGRGLSRFQAPAIGPVARIESPHLYRVPRPITAELLERRKLISTIYLILCCCFPFMALAYGYGLLDWIINAHMDGEIEGWNETHTAFARIWAVVVTLGYIVAIGVAWAVLWA